MTAFPRALANTFESRRIIARAHASITRLMFFSMRGSARKQASKQAYTGRSSPTENIGEDARCSLAAASLHPVPLSPFFYRRCARLRLGLRQSQTRREIERKSTGTPLSASVEVK